MSFFQLRKIVFSNGIIAACYAATAILPTESDRPRKRIAIIGSGVGGCSTAYFLSEKFGKAIEIDVYEKYQIGGRVRLVEISGRSYEAGASILHKSNRYTADLSKKFGYHEKDSPSTEKILGLYDGDKMVFTSSSSDIITGVRVLLHYGFDYFKLSQWRKKLLPSFTGIYPKQLEKNDFFPSVDEFLRALNEKFYDFSQTSIDHVLSKDAIGQSIIHEFVSAGMQANYGQTVNSQGFVGTVAVFGMDANLWCVHGGNNQICQPLLAHSGANLHRERVTAVERVTAKGGEVTYKVYSSESKEPRVYDFVVVAFPIHRDNCDSIEWRRFTLPVDFREFKMHRTVATMIHGEVDWSWFNWKQPLGARASMICTTDRQPFHSIGFQFPVDYRFKEKTAVPSVWKVFSNEPLSDEWINRVFKDIKEVQVIDWLAYPDYTVPQSFPPIRLDHGIFYVNAIEWAASCMELSIIAARNIANWLEVLIKDTERRP